MKRIAFPTDDGETISRHLGEAQFYIVALLDDMGNVTFERREKPHHHHNPETPSGEQREDHTQRGPAMFTPVLDCQILISGGMGQPAYGARAGGDPSGAEEYHGCPGCLPRGDVDLRHAARA